MENEVQKTKINCLSCGGNKINFFTRKNNHDIYSCKSCKLIFVWPLPENTAHIYGGDYFKGAQKGFGYVDYDQDKPAMLSAFNRCLDKIEKVLPEKGNLLDIGAATGYFIKIAENRGWSGEGLEISQYAVDRARQKNLNVRQGLLSAAVYQPESFGLVTLWDVIEHLPDPNSDLLRVFNILKHGGVAAINTPDSSSFFAKLTGKNWHLLVPPEHLVYFNPDNLSGLLKKSGFEVVSIDKLGKKFTLQYVSQTLYRWQKLFIWKWLAEFLRTSPIGKLSVPINLRDNFLIIAKKI